MSGETSSRSGHFSFELEVPYALYETGSAPSKPLIVYLHGFKQHIAGFRAQTHRLQSLEAYHLFIQGPYVVYDRSREKNVSEWGRAWYLYDGNPGQFVRSLEHTSAFLENIISTVQADLDVSRTALFGYSMGGYQAGHVALSRPELVDDLVVVGARIKTEVFRPPEHDYRALRVLALHGRHDRSVKSGPQRKSCDELSKWGADVTFMALNAGHKLSDRYLKETKKWFLAYGYE